MDSSEDENDEAFFKAEAALRVKRDLLARQGILTNGVESKRSPQKQTVKKLKLQSNIDPEDPEEENEKVLFRVGIEREQETLEEIPNDQISMEEEEETEMSAKRNMIKKIMGDTEMNYDSDVDDIENQITNNERDQPIKKGNQKDKSDGKDPGTKLKKRARVIIDSDSD